MGFLYLALIGFVLGCVAGIGGGAVLLSGLCGILVVYVLVFIVGMFFV